MKNTIKILKENNLLKIINKEVDVNLEIAHIAYIEAKKRQNQKPKALLFTNVVDKANNKKFTIPVLMNTFCNDKAIELFVGDINDIANNIGTILKPKMPKGFLNKLKALKNIINIKNTLVKKVKKTTKYDNEHIIKLGDNVNLFDIPILKTWSDDSGKFITMGHVYTQSLDGSKKNLGMYRLQVYDKNTLGMHWQIHKDGNHFFHEYKKAGKKMPVSIGIGGNPLYIWCGQAPLPIGIYELGLYGFIKKQRAKVVKCVTNELFVPIDCDFIIEGYVDTQMLKDEGPFGDHTGYYTLKEPYPVLKVNAIISKKEPIYQATVVGKPPLEDKYMAKATQHIFAPMLKITAPYLIDYNMPENGVFHNFILVKIKTLYPAGATQCMHSLWGIGQMSFVKNIIVVGENAPKLDDYKNLTKYILDNFDISKVLFSKGIIDALDHTSDKFAYGGKIGIDVTCEIIKQNKDNNKNNDFKPLKDKELFAKLKEINKDTKTLKQFFTTTNNPITIISVDKSKSQAFYFNKIAKLNKHLKILIIVDELRNDINNLYMILWRVVNNIDGNRDVKIINNVVFVDGTNKTKKHDNFLREWPDDVLCDKNVLKSLQKRKLIPKLSNEFISKWGIL
jgi:4-hydroxy-3-polyprenylbenzoate decarboxylase